MAYEDGVFATFYDDKIFNKSKSRDSDVPVYDDVIMLKIQVPNQHDSVPRPSTEADKVRFPKSWEAYKTGQEAPIDGHAIKFWPLLTGGELKVLEACQIKTVEQLAELPDAGIHRLGPSGQNLKQRAIKYLSNQARAEELSEKLAAAEKRIAELETKTPQPKNIRMA